MNITKDQWTGIARTILVALLAICAILGYDIGIVQPREAAIAARAAQPLTRGITHYTELEADTVKAAAPTAVGTATPAMIVDSLGVSNILEVRDAATPVFTIADGGGVSWPSGALHVSAPTAIATATPAFFVDSSGVSNVFEVRNAATPVFSVSAGGVVSWPSGALKVAGATAIATATPAFVADSLGVSAIVEMRDAATPVWQLADGGGVTHTGDSTQTGYADITGGAYIAAPTAIATATPVFMVNSSGVSNLLELRAAATPVVYSDNTGALTVQDLTAADDVTITDDLTVTGLINWTYGEENIGLPSIISTAITYTASTGGTGAVATIADGEVWFVHAVFVNVTTNFDCTGDDATLIIGDGADTDGFVVLADAELQTADTEGTGWPAGWQGLVAATMGVYLDGAVSSAPHIYAPSGSAETIDWLVSETTGDTLTAGAATIYIIYTRIS